MHGISGAGIQGMRCLNFFRQITKLCQVATIERKWLHKRNIHTIRNLCTPPRLLSTVVCTDFPQSTILCACLFINSLCWAILLSCSSHWRFDEDEERLICTSLRAYLPSTTPFNSGHFPCGFPPPAS